MSSYVYINSKDRTYISANPSSFEIELNQSDSLDYQNSIISIQSITFANLNYPINIYNNVIVFQENGINTDLTATIPQGIYDASTFCTQLSLALGNPGVESYTCSISSTTGLLSISSTGTLKIKDCSGLKVIGFEAMIVFSNSALGNYPVNLAGSNYVDIVIHNFYTRSTKTGTNIGEVFCRIPLNKPFGNVITWQNTTDDNQQVSMNVNNLRFELFDEWERPFILPNNANISIQMKISFPL